PPEAARQKAGRRAERQAWRGVAFLARRTPHDHAARHKHRCCSQVGRRAARISRAWLGTVRFREGCALCPRNSRSLYLSRSRRRFGAARYGGDSGVRAEHLQNRDKHDPLPLRLMPREALNAITVVLCDIDDTLTLNGRLVGNAFVALERLRLAGMAVVPVTGRPAGWCDHIARMWPVDGVVGENGAFYFWFAGGKLGKRFIDDAATRAGNRAQLAAIGERILSEVPGAALASDQPY